MIKTSFSILLIVFCLINNSHGFSYKLDSHLYSQVNYALHSRASSCNRLDCESRQGDYRFRIDLDMDAYGDLLSLIAKSELTYHSLETDSNQRYPADKLYNIHELYLDNSHGLWAMRIGKQIITWGIADTLYLNDIFPKNWHAFYTGMPIDYLKLAVEAAKFNIFFADTSFELIINNFIPDELPNTSFFNLPNQEGQLSRKQEYGLKHSGFIKNKDYSIYLARSHVRTAIRHSNNTFLHPSYFMLGGNISSPLAKGILGVEMSMYRKINNPALQKTDNQFKLLTAYTMALKSDSSLSLQNYISYNSKGVNSVFSNNISRKFNDLISLRLNMHFLHQTLKFEFLSIWDVLHSELLSRGKATYVVDDNISIELGISLIKGEHEGSFHPLDRNDNVFISAKMAL